MNCLQAIWQSWRAGSFVVVTNSPPGHVKDDHFVGPLRVVSGGHGDASLDDGYDVLVEDGAHRESRQVEHQRDAVVLHNKSDQCDERSNTQQMARHEKEDDHLRGLQHGPEVLLDVHHVVQHLPRADVGRLLKQNFVVRGRPQK